MAEQNVVDELVVTLELNADDYKKTDKQVNQLVDQTEKQQQSVETKRKNRDRAQQTRNKDTLAGVKDLASGLRGLTLTIGAMLGIGSAAGIIGAVVAFTGMETGLRRAAVSTGMSNRELQAWGSTARRLGADAAAGQEAIAGLAREQQQYALTGQAPTMTALSRIGVQVGPNTAIQDMLAQAQQIYRAAPQNQKQNIEATLSASGVSADLIVAIKSEKDVREEFARSYAESATENRKALDSVTDALTGVANSALNMANSIATILQPQIEQFANYVSAGAASLSEFVDEVQNAGGGIDGFMRVLDEKSPELADDLRKLGTALDTAGEAIDVITYGFQELGRATGALFKWIDDKFGKVAGGSNHQIGDAVGTVGKAIAWAWRGMVDDARTNGAAPIGHLTGEAGSILSKSSQARLADNSLQRAMSGSPQQAMMSDLITRYGLSVDQAAAVTANMQRESSGNPHALNPDGGGTGARGLLQWRGPRAEAFRKRYGVMPDQGSADQQMEFMMTDPYERSLLNRSLGPKGDAHEMGNRFATIFEGTGNVAENLKRAQLAQQMAAGYTGPQGGPGIGQTINVQNVTVQANDPKQFGDQLKRVSGVQNYNTAVN